MRTHLKMKIQVFCVRDYNRPGCMNIQSGRSYAGQGVFARVRKLFENTINCENGKVLCTLRGAAGTQGRS